MAPHARTAEVAEADRRELKRRARAKGAPARVVERARIVLLAGDGMPGKQIASRVGCAEPTVVTWRRRYAEHGLAALEDLPRPGSPSPLPEALRDRVLELTLTEPPSQFGATHWSSRLLAAALAGEGNPIAHTTVARIWHRFGVQPWRAQTFKFSTDPALETKIRDVVGLYLHPPEKAVVLCVEEKPQVQALERTVPVLPVRPGHPEAASFDYVRHGTTTLFAALEVATGKVTDTGALPDSDVLATHHRAIISAALIGTHDGITPPGAVGRRHRALARRIRRRLDDYLRFATDPRVPFDNNPAEQDIRMAKIKQKVSGGMRTLAGAQDFAAMRSYLSTAAKHGRRPFDALTELTSGKVWNPATT